MIRIINRFDEADKLLWEELLTVSGYAGFFQTPGYYRFSMASAGHEPFLFIGEGNGRYDILMAGNIQYENNPLTRAFSKRAIVNGGVVIREGTDHADVLRFLENACRGLDNKAIYLEIRNLHNYSEFISVFAEAGFSYVPHLNFQVNVVSRDDAFGSMNQSRRRQVRKSLDTGAEIVSKPSVDEVKQFYAILRETYSRKVHRPLPGEDFFLRFLNSRLGIYLLVRYNMKILGGIMCPIFHDRIIYEWYVAGEDGKQDGIYPSVLATWAAIEYAAMNGIKTFDFMGAGSPGQQYGVREFKSKFGGTQVEYGRFLRVFNRPIYNTGKMVFGILKKS